MFRQSLAGYIRDDFRREAIEAIIFLAQKRGKVEKKL